MTESSVANTAQHEYWNTVAGPRWVGLGGYVERRVRAVNDLLLARSAAAAPAPLQCLWPRPSVSAVRLSGSTSPSQCWPAPASAYPKAASATSRC